VTRRAAYSRAARLIAWLAAAALVASPGLSEQLRVIRNARLYVEPTSLSVRIRVLHPAESVTRLSAGQTNDYIHVRSSRSETGWVYRHSLAAIVSEAGGGPISAAALDLPALAGNQMRIHFIDVGQGQSTLLEFPCGVALIDTGGEQSPENVANPDFDSVPALRAYLDAFFSKRPDLGEVFDLLAITHPHIDHTRGIGMVSSTYFLSNIIDNGQHHDDGGGRPQIELEEWAAENEEVLKYQPIAKKDITSNAGLTDAIIDPIGPCAGSAVDPTIRVLWGGLAPGDAGEDNTNNNSLVLRMDFGEFSLLLTGDLQKPGITALLSKYSTNPAILDVDVYQVGHHGSHNATTAALVAAMSPAVAVFSMGPFARERGKFIARKFGHPNHEAVEPLEAGVTCTRTAVREQIGIKGAFQRNPAEFEERTITAGLFATGWDGNIVLTADSDGSFKIATSNAGSGGVGLACPE
jgi:competence protein ComEC